MEEVAEDYVGGPNDLKSIKVVKLSTWRKCDIVVDLLVYHIRSTDDTTMDIKYATGLTTITNANKGTQEAVGAILEQIIEKSTTGLEIEGLEAI